MPGLFFGGTCAHLIALWPRLGRLGPFVPVSACTDDITQCLLINVPTNFGFLSDGTSNDHLNGRTSQRTHIHSDVNIFTKENFNNNKSIDIVFSSV